MNGGCTDAPLSCRLHQKPEDLASFRNLSKAEQDAVDAVGIKEWSAWEERNASSILDPGGIVGKTTPMTKEGVVTR